MRNLLLIEPVFEGGQEIVSILNWAQNIPSNLVSRSGVLATFALKISQLQGDKPIKLILNNINIKNNTINYKRGFKKIEINWGKGKEVTRRENDFKLVFPMPGLYWLELEIKPEDAETRQRMLNGEIGIGWSCEKKKNFLRQPILVVDSNIIEQIKINREIKRLTYYILALTVINVLVVILSLFLK